MTIERTAKGAVTDKTGTTTLTIPNVNVGKFRALVIGVAYDLPASQPEVKWGDIVFKQLEGVGGNGIACGIASYYRLYENRTEDIVITWSDTIPTAKAAFASEIRNVGTVDQRQGNTHVNASDVATGPEIDTLFDNEIFIAAMGSEGPVEDDSGTIQYGYLSGQRVGTTGGAADSNITIHEIYKIVTSTETTRGAKTGCTARDWSNILVTLRETQWHRVGITATDLMELYKFFDQNNLDLNRHGFHYNTEEDRWELYLVTEKGTLIAHTGLGGWTVV